MFDLSEDEKTRLAAIVRDQYGHFLLLDQFRAEALRLLEDIPGLECVPDTDAQSLIHELWVIHPDQGHYQSSLSISLLRASLVV